MMATTRGSFSPAARWPVGATVVATLLLASGTLITGCSPRLAPDRSAYLRTHPELSPERRQQILSGDLAVGMTTDEVEATLGRPLHRRTLREDGVSVQRWTYPGALAFRSSALRTRREQDFLAVLTFRGGILRRIEER